MKQSSQVVELLPRQMANDHKRGLIFGKFAAKALATVVLVQHPISKSM